MQLIRPTTRTVRHHVPGLAGGRSSRRRFKRAVIGAVRYLSVGINRRAMTGVVGGGAALLALGAPAAASAGQVPERGGLSARLVTASPTAKSKGVHSLPLRTLNPARYAQQKAAANKAYHAWAARHPQAFGPG